MRRRCFLHTFLIGVILLLLWLRMRSDLSTMKTKSITKNEHMHLGGQKVNSIFYLKIHKTGSTTLQNILSRYALKHNLRVASYKKLPAFDTKTNTMLEHLTPDFVVGKSRQYNLILDESYFSPDTIKRVFQQPIVYITMVRNPVSWLESYLHFINAVTSLGLDKKSVAASFVKRLDDVEWYKKNEEKLESIRQDVYTKAFMLDPSQRNITEQIAQLAETFIVGITEKYDESLILMRRSLGWSFQEVLYSSMRVQAYSRSPLDADVYSRLCKWIPYDCFLYEYFKKTFMDRISAEGDDFNREVSHFKDVQESISDFCTLVYKEIREAEPIRPSLGITIEATAWHGTFTFTELNCALARLAPWTYRPLFYYKQNPTRLCTEDCPTSIAKGYLHLQKNTICNRICKLSDSSTAIRKLLTNKNAFFWSVHF